MHIHAYTCLAPIALRSRGFPRFAKYSIGSVTNTNHTVTYLDYTTVSSYRQGHLISGVCQVVSGAY